MSTSINTNSNLNCNFCKKSYNSLSSLNYHQKNAKFCLELQNKLKNGELIRCDFCLKEFTSKKYLNQHNEICKQKKTIEQTDTKRENDKLHKEISDLKVKFDLSIKFKDETIEKLQKELEYYKKLANRPTTVNHTTNNYQIEFNQLVQNIDLFNDNSLSDKIKSITLQEMDGYDPKNLEDCVSHSLSNKIKDYTFCTDKARKMVVIKKENDIVEKISIKEFINLCLNTGLSEIRNYIKSLEEHYDTKLLEYKISDENFLVFDDSLQKIKEYMSKSNIDITDSGHPLKMLPDKVLSNCKHINK
jgi:hypothetical protein